jgi:chemotaxis protein MotB
MAAALIGAIVVGGCVSTSQYKKVESDLNTMKSNNATLQADLLRLQQANTDLAKEKEDLQKAKSDTTSQYDSLVNQLQQEVQEGQLKVTQYKNMLTVDVAEKIFFDSGSAKLKKTGKAVLKKVADALKNYKDKAILVVGHTDAVPVSKSFQDIFPSNWELSALRATNVVHFLQDEGGIEPERLIASGRSQYSPVAPNDTAEGRKKNRRIEISLIDKSLLSTGQEPQPQPSGQPQPQQNPPQPAQQPSQTQ